MVKIQPNSNRTSGRLLGKKRSRYVEDDDDEIEVKPKRAAVDKVPLPLHDDDLMTMTCISSFDTFDDIDKQKIRTLIKNGLQLDE